MAIILRGKTICSLCGKVIQQGDHVTASTHFISDQAHPLWKFSDSAMHRECFSTWDQAAAFRALHNQTMRGHSVMFEDGTVQSDRQKT